MTDLQLKYQGLVETKRANEAREAIDRTRSEVEQAKQALAQARYDDYEKTVGQESKLQAVLKSNQMLIDNDLKNLQLLTERLDTGDLSAYEDLRNQYGYSWGDGNYLGSIMQGIADAIDVIAPIRGLIKAFKKG